MCHEAFLSLVTGRFRGDGLYLLDEPEALGLLALMWLHEARRATRVETEISSSVDGICNAQSYGFRVAVACTCSGSA